MRCIICSTLTAATILFSSSATKTYHCEFVLGHLEVGHVELTASSKDEVINKINQLRCDVYHIADCSSATKEGIFCEEKK